MARDVREGAGRRTRRDHPSNASRVVDGRTTVDVQDASSAGDRYAAAADALLEAGLLEGIAANRVLRSRDALERLHEELLLVSTDSGSDLILPIRQRTDSGATLANAAKRIVRAHRAWMGAVRRRTDDAPLFEMLADAMRTTPSASIEALGHAIGSNLEHREPSPTAWLQLRGPDARTYLRRLPLRRYTPDKVGDLLATHTRAEEVALRWKRIGAVAEITTSAAALANWIGVAMDDVVSGLSRSPELRIRGRSACDRPTVIFRWLDFAITAEVDRRSPHGAVSMVGDWLLRETVSETVLELPGINVPAAVLVKLEGQPLRRLAAARMLDGTTRIKEAEPISTGGVSLVLERRTVPVTLIGNSLVAGPTGDTEPPAADR